MTKDTAFHAPGFDKKNNAFLPGFRVVTSLFALAQPS